MVNKPLDLSRYESHRLHTELEQAKKHIVELEEDIIDAKRTIKNQRASARKLHGKYSCIKGDLMVKQNERDQANERIVELDQNLRETREIAAKRHIAWIDATDLLRELSGAYNDVMEPVYQIMKANGMASWFEDGEHRNPTIMVRVRRFLETDNE